MATKFAVTVTFSVLFLFVLSNARDPSDQQGNGVTTLEGLNTFPEPNLKTTNTIILPSEKPDTEPATVLELEPETTEPNDPERERASSSETEPLEFEESTETRTTSPLAVISLRPIKHHYFPRLLPFSGHRHGCHHHLRREFKPWGPRLRPEFSYEEEMVPKRKWAGRFPDRDGARYWVVRDEDLASWRDEDELRHFRRFHRHHHHHHDEDREELKEKEERRHEGVEEEDGGIFKGIRKFLNPFQRVGEVN